MAAQETERFGPTSGRFSGVAGLVLVALLAVGALADGWQASDPAVLCGLALLGLVMAAALLRPVVLVDGEDLVLRNMFSTTRVRLAAIDEVQVRHLLTVLAGGHTLHSTAVNRKRSEGLRRRHDPGADARPPGMADLVETRLGRLAADARRTSPVAADPADRAGDVRRAWSWPLVSLAAALAVGCLVLLLVP